MLLAGVGFTIYNIDIEYGVERKITRNLPYGTRLKQKFMEQFVRFTLPKLHGCKFSGLVLMATALALYL